MDTVDIMPKTPHRVDDIIGKIGEGAVEVGDATVDMTIGLVADMLINPTELEAGFLMDLGRGISNTMQKAQKGVHVMPTKGGFTEMFEYSTANMVKELKAMAKVEGKFDDFMVDRILDLDVDKLKNLDTPSKQVIANKIYELKSSPMVKFKDDLGEGVKGIHHTITNEGIQGRTEIAKDIGSDNSIVDTIIHELQHGVDSSNPPSKPFFEMEYMNSVPYDRDASEIMANVAATRKTLPQSVTNLMHPLIGIGNKSINIQPAEKLMTSLLETGDMTIQQAKEFRNYMQGEVKKVSTLMKDNEAFNKLLGTELHNTEPLSRMRTLVHSANDLGVNTTTEVLDDIIHFSDTTGVDGKTAMSQVKHAYTQAGALGQIPSEQVRIQAHKLSKEVVDEVY